LKNAILGQPSATKSQGDYIGPRRGYVAGAGSVHSMECYEIGGRNHQYPASVKEAQKEIARNPKDLYGRRALLASLAKACGPLPQLYTEQEHQVWLEKKEEENARFRAAYEGSEMQKRDLALMRLLEPLVERDAPGSHVCNHSEKQQYANAKEIVGGGRGAGFSKNELDGALLTIGLIENRCGTP